MEIRLDKETFKALASETRVDVLKVLGQRRHMQSEIAASLSLSVPTIKEHLDALEKAGLVERHEEGRKWKYYSLTKKGKGVLNPEEMKIWIVLGTFILSVVGGIATIAKIFVQPVQPAQAKLAIMAMESAPHVAESVQEAMEPNNPWWLYAFGIVAILSAAALVYLLYKSAEYKRQLGKSLSKK